MGDQNGQAPQAMVAPHPLPTQYIIAEAQVDDGSKMVVLQFITPAGNTVIFLPVENAKEFAEQVLTKAQEASSGLVIPRIVPPNLGG